jgi:hypothetical protein
MESVLKIAAAECMLELTKYVIHALLKTVLYAHQPHADANVTLVLLLKYFTTMSAIQHAQLKLSKTQTTLALTAKPIAINAQMQ